MHTNGGEPGHMHARFKGTSIQVMSHTLRQQAGSHSAWRACTPQLVGVKRALSACETEMHRRDKDTLSDRPTAPRFSTHYGRLPGVLCCHSRRVVMSLSRMQMVDDEMLHLQQKMREFPQQNSE